MDADVLTRTTELLRAAATGRARALVLQGDLGIGKTTLVDEVREAAHTRAFDVIETRGIEADTQLGFGALLTLLRPLDRELDDLATPYADDLRAALTLGTPGPTDDGRVRLALYRVVTSLAERRPLLVVVDDAHHLDAATSDALAFVIGRLAQDSVAVVLTTDGALPGALAELDLAVERVRGMPRDELAAIVTAQVGEIAPEALEQCCSLADGNPLIALELARSLSDDERAGSAAMSVRPKPPATLARRLAMRFGSFDPVATRALVVVAADDTGRPAIVRAALQALGEPDDALDRAEQTGMIELDGPTLRFTHPVLRAVAYHQVAPASRRSAHRALAVALADPDDAVARAWQLAAAADGEDELAAEALELVAGDLARRGAASSAAQVYERAAALSPKRSSRSARALRAAECWLDAHTPDAAMLLLTDLDLGTDPDLVVGVVAADRHARGPVAALERIRALGSDTPSVVARALEADLLLDTTGEPAAADQAQAVLDDTSGDPAAATTSDEVDARTLAALVLARAGGDEPDEPPPSDSRAGRLVALRHRQLRAEHGCDITAPRAPSSLDAAIVAATTARHRGDVVSAYDRLQIEADLVPERATRAHALLDLALADVEQLLGRADDARLRLERALALLDADHARGLAAAGAWVSGRLTVGDGDVEQGCGVLELAARARPSLYGPELAVALAGLGRTAAAEQSLAVGRLGADPGPVVQVRFARARAAIRSDDDRFDRAAAEAEGLQLPIEAAETRLAHAEHLARTGRVDDARAVATTALEELDRCGVRGWDQRVARVRDGAATNADVAAELTSAEYRVALAVSGGATNREAAATLFLSVKTVDFHLQNIYRKLGLRSRTELAVRLHGDGGGAR